MIWFTAGAFLLGCFKPVYAQSSVLFDLQTLPSPGQRIALSQPLDVPVLRGIKVFAQTPFRFDFILDQGKNAAINKEIDQPSVTRLIQYFLAALTTPEKNLWVNLSPYEKERIIPDAFGQTYMGRDLLAQDYLLKQITASLLYPKESAGKQFWDKVYAQVYEKYGTTDVPLDTFNKVWIVPQKAVVFEKASPRSGEMTAFVTETYLKVMLESDYVALDHAVISKIDQNHNTTSNETQELTKEIVREVVVPLLEQEVNAGAHFAPLRQIYFSLVLAAWYKRKVKDSLLSRIYVDQNKVSGVNTDDPRVAEKIWAKYVEAFKQGVFNYVQDEKDLFSSELIPRKYFAGGVAFDAPQLDQAMRFTKEATGFAFDSSQMVLVEAGIKSGGKEGDFSQLIEKALEISSNRLEEIRKFDEQVSIASSAEAKIELLVKALAKNEPGITLAVQGRAKELLSLMKRADSGVFERANIIAQELDQELINQGSSRIRRYPKTGDISFAPYQWGMKSLLSSRMASREYFRAMSLNEIELMAEFGSMYAVAEYNNMDVYSPSNMATWADSRLKADGVAVLLFNIPNHLTSSVDYGPGLVFLGSETISREYIEQVSTFGNEAKSRLELYLSIISNEDSQSDARLAQLPVKYVDVKETRQLSEDLLKMGKMKQEEFSELKSLLDKISDLKAKQLFNDEGVLGISLGAMDNSMTPEMEALIKAFDEGLAKIPFKEGDIFTTDGKSYRIDKVYSFGNNDAISYYAIGREKDGGKEVVIRPDANGYAITDITRESQEFQQLRYDEKMRQMLDHVRKNQSLEDRARVAGILGRIQGVLLGPALLNNLPKRMRERIKQLELIVAQDIPTFAAVIHEKEYQYLKPLLLLHSAFVKDATDAQIAFVVGHELGHLLFEYVNVVADSFAEKDPLRLRLLSEIENRADAVGVVAALEASAGSSSDDVLKVFEKLESIRTLVEENQNKWGLEREDPHFDVHRSKPEREKDIARIRESYGNISSLSNRLDFLERHVDGAWPDIDPALIEKALRDYNIRSEIMPASVEVNKGGIDFNPVDKELEVNGNGVEVRFNIDPAMLERYRDTAGFEPVILNMKPLNNLPQFLGTGSG